MPVHRHDELGADGACLFEQRAGGQPGHRPGPDIAGRLALHTRDGGVQLGPAAEQRPIGCGP